MQTVTMDEAKAQLPELLEAAAHGEPFQITREGQSVINVVAYHAAAPGIAELKQGKMSNDDQELARVQDRRFGTLEGQFTIPDDFDTYMQDEIIAMFEGDGKL